MKCHTTGPGEEHVQDETVFVFCFLSIPFLFWFWIFCFRNAASQKAGPVTDTCKHHEWKGRPSAPGDRRCSGITHQPRVTSMRDVHQADKRSRLRWLLQWSLNHAGI